MESREISLRFDEQGLIPVIVQDYYSKQVLTLAYMNAEALALSIAEQTTCFYSRSRQQLWRKGETSGNTQRLVSLTADCDGDALVAEVIKAGPACHTGAESCFYQPVFLSEEVGAFSYDALYQLLQQRLAQPQQGSYTSYLFEKGLDKILKKIGEESTEVIIAAKDGNERETVYEIADLCYHLLVLMVATGIPLQAVFSELASRQIVDEKRKQEKPDV